MKFKIVFCCFLFLFLIFSKNIEAANTELVERATTIRILSLAQCAVVTGVTSAVAWSFFENIQTEKVAAAAAVLVPMLGFTCGVADLVCAVYFPGRDVRNNPYLIFGSVEMLFGTYCFGSESFNWRSWLGAAALIYCGAERYCMAPLLADRRYVTPFPPVRRYDVPF